MPSRRPPALPPRFGTLEQHRRLGIGAGPITKSLARFSNQGYYTDGLAADSHDVGRLKNYRCTAHYLLIWNRYALNALNFLLCMVTVKLDTTQATQAQIILLIDAELMLCAA